MKAGLGSDKLSMMPSTIHPAGAPLSLQTLQIFARNFVAAHTQCEHWLLNYTCRSNVIVGRVQLLSTMHAAVDVDNCRQTVCAATLHVIYCVSFEVAAAHKL